MEGSFAGVIRKAQHIFCFLSALLLLSALTGCITVTERTAETGEPENTPESVVLRLVEAVQTENAEALLKIVHLPDRKKGKPNTEEIGLEQAKQAVALGRMLMQQQGGVASVITGEPQYSDSRKQAEIAVTIQFRNGGSRTTSRTLVLVNNRWMLSMRWR